jgi:glycosyltransferase involved in cell wall biosynthesis
MNEDVWIIIPAYNEGKRIGTVIDKTKEYVQNIVVVDDGSKDNTIEVAKEKGVFVLEHLLNMGKGTALKTGCEFVLEKGAKVIIAVDADGQHDPAEIPNFINTIKEENDIVFGYRKMTKEMPGVLKFGNWFIGKMMSLLFKIDLKDTQCGYRAFTADAYKKIAWEAQNYDVESEMIVKVGKKKLKYKEIPIQTIYSDIYKGTTVMDGIKIVLKLIWWKITRW